MRTRDDFSVSDLTKMCDHHNQQTMLLLAQVFDSRHARLSDDETLKMSRQYLSELRAECVEQCGRVDEVSA